jgi:methyl-accepting chemotaxis protein
MLDVSTAAERSGQTSQTVLLATDQVTQISSTLRQEIDHFVAAMRVSAESKDGRMYERVPGGNAVVTLRCDTHGNASAKLINISSGGAALACDWLCQAGTEIMLRLPGDGPEVSSRVVDVRAGVLVVAFRQDPETLGHLDQAVSRIAAQTANQGQALVA